MQNTQREKIGKLSPAEANTTKQKLSTKTKIKICFKHKHFRNFIFLYSIRL